MTTELRMLGYSIFLGLAYVFVAAILSSRQRGLKWNAGNRDGDARPLTGVAARAARASANFLETFPLFAAAVLAVVLARQHTPHTALGAQLYFWGRLLYLPVYLIGIPYLRTLIWVVALWGMLQVVEGLF
ncbi:MAG: MAPEG family protein [Steroidobacteraceae bacterium]